MNLPDFLTVVEAARVLRIGRTVAYEQAALYEATGGAEGLPVVRLGRQFRVPRARLGRSRVGRSRSRPQSQRLRRRWCRRR